MEHRISLLRHAHPPLHEDLNPLPATVLRSPNFRKRAVVRAGGSLHPSGTTADCGGGGREASSIVVAKWSWGRRWFGNCQVGSSGNFSRRLRPFCRRGGGPEVRSDGRPEVHPEVCAQARMYATSVVMCAVICEDTDVGSCRTIGRLLSASGLGGAAFLERGWTTERRMRQETVERRLCGEFGTDALSHIAMCLVFWSTIVHRLPRALDLVKGPPFVQHLLFCSIVASTSVRTSMPRSRSTFSSAASMQRATTVRVRFCRSRPLANTCGADCDIAPAELAPCSPLHLGLALRQWGLARICEGPRQLSTRSYE